MARSAPLIPLPVLLLALALLLAALVVSALPNVRARVPWLLPEAAVFATLCLLHLLFFWEPYRTPALVPAGGGDLASFFYPIHAFAAGEIQAGRFPFWGPNQFSGMPHLANFQTAALYPPNVLAYLLAEPFTYATMERLALAHYLLASIGTYWLARALGMGRAGAVLASALLAYSGFMVAHLGHYSMLATASWAPWVYAALVATIRRRSWSYALAGTPALACCILGGHQPILLMIAMLGVALAGFELWRAQGYPPVRDWPRELRERALQLNALRLAVMALLALGLALPALGPMLELTRYTARGSLSYEAASEFAVEPVALLHMLLPTLYGSNPTDYWGAFSNTEVWGYTGVLALALAAYAVAVKATRTRVFWIIVAVLAVLYMLGPFVPLHGWAYAFLPGFDRIRGAGRAYLFVDLAVALLAGFGAQALLTSRASWTGRQLQVTRWGLLGLAVALGIVVALLIPLMASRVVGVNDPGNRPVIALDNLNLLALWLLLGLGVALAAWRGALAGGALLVAVYAVTLLDLFHATAPFNPTNQPILAGFEHPQVVEFIRQQEAERGPFRIEVLAPTWQPDLARLQGLENIGGLVDPLALRDYEEYLRQARADRAGEQYRALNVAYLITAADQEPPGPPFSEAFRGDDGLVVWEYANPLPRAWLVDDPSDPVTVTEREPGRLTLALPLDVAAGTLVVSQVNYPGWTAEVDGEAVDVVDYEGVLQAVELPAGAREVELTFRPTLWLLWVGLAALSAIGWLAGVVTVVLRNRRGARERKGTYVT